MGSVTTIHDDGSVQFVLWRFGANSFGWRAVSHFYREGYQIQDSVEKPIRNILDCGANIGDETARFLHHHPLATIIAVEAERSKFDMLRNNFKNNKNVIPIHAGVWPIDTKLNVLSRTSMESFVVVEANEILSEYIIGKSIVSIMQDAGWDKIDILKLDIEGAEFHLFSHNTHEWLHLVNVIIFEACDIDRLGCTQKNSPIIDQHRFSDLYLWGKPCHD